MSCEQVFFEKLRERGFRFTPQREIVLSVMHQLEGMSTAEEIWERVQTHSSAVDISTVYRTLELLQDFDLVTSVDPGDGRRLFELLGLHGPHLHLVCRRCGRIDGVELDLLRPLAAQLLQQHAFTLAPDHLTLPGLCAACA